MIWVINFTIQIILADLGGHHELYISYRVKMSTFCLEDSCSKVHQSHQTNYICRNSQQLNSYQTYSPPHHIQLVALLSQSLQEYCQSFAFGRVDQVDDIQDNSTDFYSRIPSLGKKQSAEPFNQLRRWAHRRFIFGILRICSKMGLDRAYYHPNFCLHQRKPFGFEGIGELLLRLRLQLLLANCICKLLGFGINNSFKLKTIILSSRQQNLLVLILFF